MADEKNETPKTPQPQNTGAPERPKMPENRIVHGNDPRTGVIQANNPGRRKP